ncbi:TonB-dependent receptor domain-containing protein [Brevundimonas sp. Root1279]|uniref:TonB-dependent receptor domain-containing protein n=1 Tax=Brevundimonas sp. Root1279 TaxID=1736443 RepID=UPI000A4BE44E|nr:TonB-dependent receptor [Brevundimonas sp. Root1279]
MSFRTRLSESSALTGGVIAAILFATPVFAQDPPPPQSQAQPQQEPDDDDAEDVGDVIVTGSRIPQNEFTSSSPIQVLTTERGQQRGLSDTAQLLQSSTIAAGSPQVNSTISSAFVTDGGPGASTISLRGLGANRTLVLLNGRRAGPAGTRGGVSAFDLNVIPQSAINRIDVLKDGASSIYGSDAIAGVVNLITERSRDGGEMSAFASLPFESGGEQYNISGAWGKTFDRGYFNISADWYLQEQLRAGDRDYLTCSNQYVFEPGTRTRADRIDPRTGQPQCNDVVWGQVFSYGINPVTGGLLTRPGRFQFDYDGNLGQFIPPRPANPAIDALYPQAPPGFYLVNYDPASRAVVNASHPTFQPENTIIPETERYTVFLEGAYELGGGVEAYAELLLNRRESRTDSYRQFWNYVYTSDFLDLYFGAPGFGGDPLNGFSGLNILSPTPVTDHFDASQKVDYTRLVLGVRGDISGGFMEGWHWDVYGQYSRSDGEYTSDVILDDAVNSTSFKTESCVGTNLPISGRPCIDVDFTRPGFLAGDLTPEERAFLFDVETGTTIYEQTYFEGSIAGNLWELPAGPLGLAVGFHVRRDEIVDTPGDVTLADNSWGLTGAGITAGKEDTKEIYAEFAIPLIVDQPYVKSLDLSLSGRYTDTDSSGDAGTYKVGLNWAMSDAIRIRATHGTSFRAPALFELYLADQTSFLGQRAIDPCINVGDRLADGEISQELFNNCTSAAGPGGGVAPDFAGGVSSAEITTGGGLGLLEPETSVATVIGVVLTPPDSNLSLALDYFEIKIEDEVTALGAPNVVNGCYTSDNFPTDPLCNQFTRDPSLGVTEVRDQFINIAEQNNRGLDFTARWFHDFDWGTLTLDTQTTWTLENNQALFIEAPTDFLGDIGSPELVGNINLTVARGPWTAFWGFDWIGPQDDTQEYILANGSPFQVIDGRTTEVKAYAEFTGFHSVSLSYETDGWTLMGGFANVFDELPPAASAVATGTVGNSVFSSQYTEAYYGRRAFLRVSKSF